jgi:hypothetical protein
MKRLSLALVGALVVVMSLGFMGSASAAGCYPSCPTAGGSDGTITGSDWCPGTDVTISVDGDVVGTATVASDGTFSFDLPSSVDLTVDHDISVTGTAADCSTTKTVTFVLGASGGGGGGGTAFTGANVSVGLLALGALLIVGAGALLASRRRGVAAK